MVEQLEYRARGQYDDDGAPIGSRALYDWWSLMLLHYANGRTSDTTVRDKGQFLARTNLDGCKAHCQPDILSRNIATAIFLHGDPPMEGEKQAVRPQLTTSANISYFLYRRTLHLHTTGAPEVDPSQSRFRNFM